jgi:hypothetical protein
MAGDGEDQADDDQDDPDRDQDRQLGHEKTATSRMTPKIIVRRVCPATARQTWAACVGHMSDLVALG